MFRLNLLCSSLCPVPLVLAVGTTENSKALLRSSSDIDKISLLQSLTQAEQSQLSAPSQRRGAPVP